MDKVIILTEQEVVLLAAANGMKKMFGFAVADTETKPDEIIYVMQKLVQNGYLEGKEKFVLTPEIKRIFDLIENAQTILEVHKHSGRKCLIYVGSISVKVALSLRRRNCYEITEIPLNDVWKHLTDEGWITEEKG